MAAANVEGYVNIRSEANADSEIVGVLMPGYAVTVTEKETSGARSLPMV